MKDNKSNFYQIITYELVSCVVTKDFMRAEDGPWKGNRLAALVGLWISNTKKFSYGCCVKIHRL